MTRTSVRVVFVLLAFLLTAGLGYRVIDDQQILNRTTARASGFDRAADEALGALHELRASTHAYVAPGQGIAFWGARADAALDTLRKQLVVLDGASAEPVRPIADALDATDQLAAANSRARRYAERGESLLAGDVVFTEARDLIAQVTAHVTTARQALAAEQGARAASLLREQAALEAGALATWIFVAIVLLPGSRSSGRRAAEWRQDLAETIKKPHVLDEVSGVVRSAAPVPQIPPPPQAPPLEPMVPVASVQAAAEVCSALSALSDRDALPRALSRASEIIDAKGLIVWVASGDGVSLAPVAMHGYDERLVSRIGRVARDSANLTASAFRDNRPKISAATETAPAALAAPLCGPDGSIGVLSAELRPGLDADASRVALASIVAAQLATLALPAEASVMEPRRAAL